MRAMAAARRGVAPAGSALAWTLLGAAAGCGLGGEPSPAVLRLMPAAAYTDTSVTAAIYGDGFRPTYRIDARSGGAAVDPGGFSATLSPNGNAAGAAIALDGVVWQSLDLLAAEIPASTPAGWYDLVVRDPRGRTSTLPRAFQSLGIDVLPPLVRISSPTSNTVFAAGAAVPVVIVADDGFGVVTSLSVVMSSGSGFDQTHVCAPTGQSVVSCPFTYTAPAPAMLPDVLTITATATGSGSLSGFTRSSFPLVLSPAVNSFYPNSGSTRGGTAVTITGENFAADTSVAFDGMPAPTVQIQSSTSITAVTPAHAIPGLVHVSVTSGSATIQLKGQFTYLASPLIRAVQPSSGPQDGGFPVTVVGDGFAKPTTQIFFGELPLRCPRFINANRIDGLAPPGMGTLAVSAVDSLSGSIPNATVPFQYLQDDSSTSLIGAPPYDAAAGSGDAGAVDAGLLDAALADAGTDAARADAAGPEAGAPDAAAPCPEGSP